MSGLKDVKFLIPQSADEFIEQAPGQYDAMKKAVREATMDNHGETMSVDDFVRSHSQLFILLTIGNIRAKEVRNARNS